MGFHSFLRKNLNSIMIMIPILAYHLLDLFYRIINLDERFMLNAGRIVLLYKDHAPQHLTWATLLGGSLLAYTKIDYFYIFFGMRLFLLLLTYGAVFLFASSVKISRTKAALIFFLLTLIHPNFFEYFIQPRYDSFICIFLVMLFSLCQKKRELGLVSAFLIFLITFSGVKGVYYSLIPFSIIALNWYRNEYLSIDIRKFFLKFFGVWTVCLFGLYTADLVGSLFKTYQIHALVAVISPRIYQNFDVIELELRRGVLFYFGCFSFLVFFVRDKLFQKIRSPFFLVLMIVFAFIYCLIHPRVHFPMLHPMHLAFVMIGIIVLLKSDRLYLISRFSSRIFLGIFSVVILLQMIANPFFSFLPMKFEYLYTGLAQDAQTSKNLDQMIPVGATVYDPTSFVLSRRPCVKEWYLDRVYNDLRVQGLWQKDLDLKKCDFVYMRESSHYLGYEQTIQLFENFENIGWFVFRNKAYIYPEK